ncbi:glycine betaine ABC transporter substrate-binding protein [Paucibacter soli]|uniref:glycine betaine ABC transporter substrate-binding protein n=1 Tax=Paucibacter soli TaxID=3133433 RepID=UPI0030B53375
MRRLLLRCLLACCLLGGAAGAQTAVQVGSKRFTESYVLGELVRQRLQQAGVPAQHQQGLGNTAILVQALKSGSIDVYPEYSGTIQRELLKHDGPALDMPALNRALAPHGLKAGVALGFNNSYALAMREADAARLGVDSISALARLPATAQRQLRLGFSHEFLQRADGWPGLAKAYQLQLPAPAGVDHGLAYEALAGGQLDLIDVYTTDAKLARLPLRVLRDDLGFFPSYDALLLMRAGLDEGPLAALAGRIDARRMMELNAQVELDGRSFAAVAQGVLARAAAPAAEPRAGLWQRLLAPDLWRLLGQHLTLVLGSLALGVALGVPLGIWAWLNPRLAGLVMGAAGLLQTLPSLALLAFLIALLGRIGFVPALLALFLYALLPIVRMTHAGLQGVPAGLREAGRALGLRRGQLLCSIELPLALPVLLAGIKTAAVLNVGTATVAAFVGAGGLGERIVAGLAVNDSDLMLAGALPAAALALLVQWLFDVLERRLRRGR